MPKCRVLPCHRARDELPGMIGVRGKDNASDIITHYSRLESSLAFAVQRERKGSLLMSYPLDRRREVSGGWLPAVRSTTHIQSFKAYLETSEIVIKALDYEGDIV